MNRLSRRWKGACLLAGAFVFALVRWADIEIVVLVGLAAAGLFFMLPGGGNPKGGADAPETQD